MKEVLKIWILEQRTVFFYQEMKKLVEQHEKCFHLHGDYVEEVISPFVSYQYKRIKCFFFLFLVYGLVFVFSLGIDGYSFFVSTHVTRRVIAYVHARFHFS